MTNILTATRELEMTSTAYAQLAAEYYDPFHKTCRNFDAATKTALVRHPVAIPKEGLILEVGSGRGRCQEFLGVPSHRVVQLDYCQEILALTDREPCLIRVHADATSVPLFDGQFSAVIGFLIDSFIGLSFFAEAHRLLLPGGLLLVTTPAADWGHSLRGRSEPDASAARFLTKRNEVVVIPSTMIARTRIAEMLSYCEFQSISIEAEPLPTGVAPVSPDVEIAAVRQGIGVHEMPLVYVIQAKKPPR